MEGTLGDPSRPRPPGPRRASRGANAVASAAGSRAGRARCCSSSCCGRWSTAARTATRSSGPPPTGDPVTWDHCTGDPLPGQPGRRAGRTGARSSTARSTRSRTTAASCSSTPARPRNRALAGTYNPGATRGEPVLIIWSSQGRLHNLQGNTVGLGGGRRDRGQRASSAWSPGSIALDAEAHSRTYDAMAPRTQRLILVHEIGHVLGLDHVADPHQLMHAAYVGQDGLGPGDIAGLRGAARRTLRLARLRLTLVRVVREDRPWMSPGARGRRGNAGGARCCGVSRSSTSSTASYGLGASPPSQARHPGRGTAACPASSGTGAGRPARSCPGSARRAGLLRLRVLREPEHDRRPAAAVRRRAERRRRVLRVRGQDPTGCPVAWDPCEPIHFVVNPDGAPGRLGGHRRGRGLRDQEASGFEFDATAPATTARPTGAGATRGEALPVLIGWAEPERGAQARGRHRRHRRLERRDAQRGDPLRHRHRGPGRAEYDRMTRGGRNDAARR